MLAAVSHGRFFKLLPISGGAGRAAIINDDCNELKASRMLCHCAHGHFFLLWPTCGHTFVSAPASAKLRSKPQADASGDARNDQQLSRLPGRRHVLAPSADHRREQCTHLRGLLPSIDSKTRSKRSNVFTVGAFSPLGLFRSNLLMDHLPPHMKK